MIHLPSCHPFQSLNPRCVEESCSQKIPYSEEFQYVRQNEVEVLGFNLETLRYFITRIGMPLLVSVGAKIPVLLLFDFN